jgi:hypothetical protein
VTYWSCVVTGAWSSIVCNSRRDNTKGRQYPTGETPNVCEVSQGLESTTSRVDDDNNNKQDKRQRRSVCLDTTNHEEAVALSNFGSCLPREGRVDIPVGNSIVFSFASPLGDATSSNLH